MKKLLAIFLLFIHTAASSGTVLSAHYCMGDFAGIKIGIKNDEAAHCSTCGMKDMGCCHDVPKLIKLDNNHLQKTAIVFTDFKFPISFSQPTYISFSSALHKVNFQYLPSLNLGRPPSYVLNCVFRI